MFWGHTLRKESLMKPAVKIFQKKKCTISVLAPQAPVHSSPQPQPRQPGTNTEMLKSRDRHLWQDVDCD